MATVPPAKFDMRSAVRIARVVRRVEAFPVNGPGGQRGGPVELDPFPAKIGESVAFDDDPGRFYYAWVEQRRTFTGWEDKPEGRTGTTTERYALNSVEAPDGDATPVMLEPVVWIFINLTTDDDTGEDTKAYWFTFNAESIGKKRGDVHQNWTDFVAGWGPRRIFS
jgi:hypothetical protein